MFCDHCGSQIDDNVTVCPHCGTPAQPAASAAQTPPPAYPQPTPPSFGGPSPGKVLTWGILGLAFCELGLLGLIFSIVGLRMAGAFSREHGLLFGQAKVGRILAKVGLIVSIVMMVFWTFYTLFIIVLLENIIHPDLYATVLGAGVGIW